MWRVSKRMICLNNFKQYHVESRKVFLNENDIYLNDNLYMARKYARIFVRGHYLFQDANSLWVVGYFIPLIMCSLECSVLNRTVKEKRALPKTPLTWNSGTLYLTRFMTFNEIHILRWQLQYTVIFYYQNQ